MSKNFGFLLGCKLTLVETVVRMHPAVACSLCADLPSSSVSDRPSASSNGGVGAIRIPDFGISEGFSGVRGGQCCH